MVWNVGPNALKVWFYTVKLIGGFFYGGLIAPPRLEQSDKLLTV